ncbi:MAG TPA: ATP-binding cassette domain-containing protein [Bacillota bacterium]|nr:ATP-binding cassette domain-containing protein [Bacillota bacterium]
MITVNHLTKMYGNRCAISNLSFEVDKGEILGFLGPNGAGKSTTMRILTGYIAPTSGTAEIAGYDILDEPYEARRRIGYLPETPPLYNDMTVKAYLEFVGDLKGLAPSSMRAHIDAVVEKTGLEDVYHRLIGNISKGYKQRVGLAQALLGDPPVLILDEPTVGLDPNQIVEIRELIKGLAGDHTIILSSHILPEVSMVCSRVAIINRGRLIAVGTPSSLSHRMKGGSSLELRIRGPQNEVAQILRQVDGVMHVEARESDETSTLLAVKTSSGNDCRERIFFAMADAGYPILEMRPVDVTLEEVFMQLTTSETEMADALEVTASA